MFHCIPVAAVAGTTAISFVYKLEMRYDGIAERFSLEYVLRPHAVRRSMDWVHS